MQPPEGSRERQLIEALDNLHRLTDVAVTMDRDRWREADKPGKGPVSHDR